MLSLFNCIYRLALGFLGVSALLCWALTASAGQYVTVDDQTQALYTPVTISAFADINQPSNATRFVLAGFFNSAVDYQRHLLVLAGKVDFAGRLHDDAILIGGDIDINADTHAAKDLRLIAGSVRVARHARVRGNLTVMAGRVTIDGRVDGDVSLIAKSIRFGPHAEIKGRIDYTSSITPVIETGARLQHAPNAQVQTVNQQLVAQSNRTKRAYASLFIASFALLGALWCGLFPNVVRECFQRVQTQPGLCMGVGVASVLLIPLLGLVALGSVIGMSVGLLLIITYILLGSLGYVSMGFIFGAGLVKICQYSTVLDNRRWLPLLGAVGVMPLVLLAFFVKYGLIVNVSAFILGLGALVNVLWRRYRGIAVV